MTRPPESYRLRAGIALLPLVPFLATFWPALRGTVWIEGRHRMGLLVPVQGPLARPGLSGLELPVLRAPGPAEEA